ncbi:hypothetical protein SteCoe_21662 [Stentor coeruleus]|uniref:PPIase cyclophilin-type domain-containing protein n=1 Tax=Stentor coeruleus TaxID=5963 RepID=A0A1R2BP07_9CILI|nr:hypothetical protein SteCoe_21662 [Stentor coeruleus]
MVGNKAAGRLLIELFEDLTPFTAENFRGLCAGDYGKGSQGHSLSYQDSLIFKLIPNKYIIGGDIISNTGKDGDSIYGKTFVDENFDRRHSGIGLVSTYSKGPNTNSSGFIITLGECSELDDKCVVFGQVIEGINVLKSIEKTPTDEMHKPKFPIKVFNCGQVDDGRDHIKFEEFRDQINIYRAYEERKAQKKEEHLKEYYEMIQTKKPIESLNIKETCIEEENNEEIEEEENEEIVTGTQGVLAERLAKIKASLKLAIKNNEKAAADERERNLDPQWEKKQKKKEWIEKDKKYSEDLEKLGLSKEKAYLMDNIAHVGNVENKKKKKEKRSSYGWDIFNTDALMRGYKRRVNKVEIDKEQVEIQNKDKGIVVYEPPQEKVDKMAEELEQEVEKRKKFSRRRPFYEDMDASFINERNRVYNSKLQRNFKEYASEIKNNLERGTAL